MIGVIECITKDRVVQSIGHCSMSMMDTLSNNQEDQTALLCSYVSGYTLL